MTSPAPYVFNISSVDVENMGSFPYNSTIHVFMGNPAIDLGTYNVSVPPHGTSTAVDISQGANFNLTGYMSVARYVSFVLTSQVNETTYSTHQYNFSITPFDVYPGSISLSDVRPGIGQTIYIYTSACIGNGYASPYGTTVYMPTPAYNASLFVNGVKIGTYPIAAGARGCSNIQASYVIPPDVSSNFTVSISTDPDNSVEENNKANNNASSTFYLFTGKLTANLTDTSFKSGMQQYVHLTLYNGESFAMPIYGLALELYNDSGIVTSLYYTGKQVSSWNSPSGAFNVPAGGSTSQTYLVYIPDSLSGTYTLKARVYSGYTVATIATNMSGISGLLIAGDRGPVEMVVAPPLAINGVYALFNENYRHRMDSFIVTGQNNLTQGATAYVYIQRNAENAVTITRDSEVSVGVG